MPSNKSPWLNEELAPNGQPVKDNFSRWFGESMVVDSNNEPLIVYRGDPTPLTHFVRAGRREHGQFFALERDRAAYYGQVQSFYLKSERLLDLRDPYSLWRSDDVVRTMIEDIFTDYYENTTNNETGEPYTLHCVITAIETGDLWRQDGSGGFQMSAWRSLQRRVEANGFDGLMVADNGEGIGDGVDVIVFEAYQVKSAEGNSGLFDPQEPCSKDAPNAQALRASCADRARQFAIANASEPQSTLTRNSPT